MNIRYKLRRLCIIRPKSRQKIPDEYLGGRGDDLKKDFVYYLWLILSNRIMQMLIEYRWDRSRQVIGPNRRSKATRQETATTGTDHHIYMIEFGGGSKSSGACKVFK